MVTTYGLKPSKYNEKTEAEDARGKTIDVVEEINGVKRSLYWEAEKNCFDAMVNTIKGLEKYVTNWGIDFLGGRKESYIEFGTTGQSQFIVKFDGNTFGKVDKVETTYSNQEVTTEFVKLAEQLSEL